MARNPFDPLGLARVSGDPFMALHREMNRLFDDAFRGMVPPQGAQAAQGAPAQGGRELAAQDYGQMPAGRALAPSMDVSESERELRITAELPGVAEGDVEVTLDDDVLTIRGEKKFERKEDKENYHFVERSYGTFQRSLRIPWAVNPDEVQASFHNGVLTVTLPKSQAEEKSRRIAVRSGGGAGAGAQDRGTIQGGGGRGGESSGGGKGRGAGGP
jgi:HSP20 family protein